MNIEKIKQSSLVIFIVILSFLCGIIIGNKGNIAFNNNKDNITNFSQVFDKNSTKNVKNFSKVDLTLFNEVYDIVSNSYYSFNNISEKDIAYWMIDGFIKSLKDKHSEFFNIEETKKFKEVLNGNFEWIGAVVEKNDFGVIIDRIIAWSPAKEFWLLAGDIIIKANNIDLKDLSVNDAVGKIRWPAWTKIKLEIIRKWEKEILIKEVTRKKIDIPSVDYKILDWNIGYIMLSIYWEQTGDEFKKSLDEIMAKNVKWLIVDIRDNWGGYLETAVSVLSNFVEKDKTLVVTKERNPLNSKSYFSYWNEYNKKIPLIILINWNSASASEITAWALKDYNLAIITWEKSYGKWSVQEPFNLSDGSEIKITVAKWYTPLDHLIDWIGIKPDIEINFLKEDYDKKYDRQLEESKNILNKLIEFKWDVKKTIDFYNIKKQEELKNKLNNITSSGSNK